MQGFLAGFAAAFQGAGLILARPDLRRAALVPLAINLALSLVVLALAALAGWLLLPWVWREVGPQGLLGLLLAVGAVVGAALLLLGLALALYLALSAALCAAAYEALARRAALALGARPEELGVGVGALRAARDALAGLAALLLVNLAGLLLCAIPVVGAALALGLAGLAQAWFAGLEVFEHPLSLRGLDRRARLARLRQRRGEVLGLGAAVSALLLVPVLNALLLTAAVVGATILDQRWRRAEGA